MIETKTDVVAAWQIDQLVKLWQQHPDLLEPIVQRLMQENEELRWSMVVGAYQDEQINLGKAAEMLDVSELELRQRFIELGIPLRVGPVDLAEAHSDVAAIRAWFADEAEEA